MGKPEKISSDLTLVFKLLFPGMLVLLWLFDFGLFYYQHGNIKWLMLGILILSSLLVLYFLLPLKRVELDDEFIYIFKFFKKYKIPLMDIKNVSQATYLKPNFVTIEFNKKTLVGNNLRFVPKYPSKWNPFDLTKTYKEYPIVEKLLKSSKNISKS